MAYQHMIENNIEKEQVTHINEEEKIADLHQHQVSIVFNFQLKTMRSNQVLFPQEKMVK
jgi:hypothetical protein